MRVHDIFPAKIMNDESRLDRIRFTLSLLGLALLLAALYTVLRPFLIAVSWAVILVLTTWPLHRRLLRVFPRRPGIVAFISTSLLTLLLLVAIVPLLVKFISELHDFILAAQAWLTAGNVQLPAPIRRLPLLGPFFEQKFQTLAAQSEALMELAERYRGGILRFATLAARGLFDALFTVFICLFTAFFLYRHGAQLSRQVSLAVTRLGGTRFQHLLSTSKSTIKGAVYGVLATAFAQGLLAGIGYVAAGAPVPLVLGFATMVLSLVPMGTPLVYLPVAAYVAFQQSNPVAGALLAAWGIGVVSTVDNFLRPYFISQATKTPVLLVFFGVVGGIMSFGLIGLFAGPVTLALAQALWLEWVTEAKSDESKGKQTKPASLT